MTQKSRAHDALEPSRWIERFAPLVATGAHVLDLACGQGRHARLFASRGAHVLAVDRDPVALSALAGIRGIEVRAVDLEAGAWPLVGERFDAIVVANYLHRPVLALLLDALAEDGVLLYETFAVGNEAFGRPSNPAFLLRRDELWAWVKDRLSVIAFEQGVLREGGRDAVVQRLAAVGRARPWPLPLG